MGVWRPVTPIVSVVLDKRLEEKNLITTKKTTPKTMPSAKSHLKRKTKARVKRAK